MKLIAILGLFIVSACATHPQKNPEQAGQQPWQRTVAQLGAISTSNAVSRASSRRASLTSVDIEVDIQNCANGCAFVLKNKNAHVLWPNLENLLTSTSLFVSLNQNATSSSALYIVTAPAHIVIVPGPSGNFTEEMAKFVANNSERVSLNGTKLKFIGVPVIQ